MEESGKRARRRRREGLGILLNHEYVRSSKVAESNLTYTNSNTQIHPTTPPANSSKTVPSEKRIFERNTPTTKPKNIAT
ncbi:hypothetical protein Y032_0044g1057 [Ancylostoma ceylanicum]|uniref:Uncharacterized protein n=1 Tax=Ancylostoma ceylanicum TaxID=53326 RepID=A0A016UDK9_9BILA|nr:hypothetical protein Y032_0044g1057 [Ancylostoma ceylanicum]